MRAPLFLLLATIAVANAQTKRIPPPGVEVPAPVREELEIGARELGYEVARLKKDFATDPKKLAEVPSVEVFHKSVDWALRYGEFFDAKQFDVARSQLAQGMQRAKDLRKGTPGWNEANGLVVRAYRSFIDGSVQPYGLVIPADWTPVDKKPRALHLWCHGRGEKLSELSFIDERQRNKGEFVPEGAIVLHLYGRYCCANKFAGEVDAFEAIGDVMQHYSIDTQRLVVRGFSMGGASTWQFATHHPDKWAAAAPGAGFAETAEFFKSFAPGKPEVPWWEQVLWRWYDATTIAGNLRGLPIVAYSGEIDGQKQAADIMIRHAEKEGVTIPHVIGPQTGHKYHPDSKPEIEKFITEALVKGREDSPKSVRYSTHTLIYPSRSWVTITGMEKQWERADVEVDLKDRALAVTAKNVTGLRCELPGEIDHVEINGRALEGPRSGLLVLRREGGEWSAFHTPAKAAATTLGKQPSPIARITPVPAAGQKKEWPDGGQSGISIRRPPITPKPAGGSAPERQPIAITSPKNSGTCGPIDHAFMSTFLHVQPSGKPAHAAVGAWVKSEMDHATAQWRQVFRGDAPVKSDNAVTDADIKNNHLILWGDPSSNAVLKKIAAQLPVKWSADKLEFRGYSLDAAHYAPILIFPNPLNPHKYVVLNSGHTFREKAALNNSDQTPKLPDWAIIDTRVPADDRWPGLVYDAGFFDEQWK